MDVFRLGTFNNTNPSYLPDAMIEGYSSMIWTERFLDPGEFQMKTPYVDEMRAFLPELTFISHLQTKEVMVVENHIISEDSDGNPELTITGRTADAILENRFVEGTYQKRRKMAKNYTAVGAALVLLWNSVDNNSGFDVTRQRQDDDDPENSDPDHDGPRWPWTTKDILPNVAISDSVTGDTGTVKRWWLTEGELYPQLVDILNRGKLGLRTIRPPSAASTAADRVWIRSGLTDIGEIERDSTFNFTQLRFDVFKGVDRSHEQTARSKVVFNVEQDHVDNPEHLYSVQNWKTGVEVLSELNRKKDVYRDGQAGYTGWLRRTMTYDAGGPELPERPENEDKVPAWKTRVANLKDEFEEDYSEDALRELNKFRKIALFSGDISPEAPYIFKKDYDLGDKVTLKGRYGLKETAIVAEYVRTEDQEGDRGYPGLITAEDQ